MPIDPELLAAVAAIIERHSGGEPGLLPEELAELIIPRVGSYLTAQLERQRAAWAEGKQEGALFVVSRTATSVLNGAIDVIGEATGL